MRRSGRAVGAALAVVLGGAACGPILGLDSLYEKQRAADAGSVDSAPAVTLTNALCMEQSLGVPAIAVGDHCVKIEKYDEAGKPLCLAEVRPSADVLKNEGVLLIAAFVPIHGSAPLTRAEVLDYDLALSELNAVGGLPSEPRRDVAMIFCSSEPETAPQAVKHVAHDLHVPAVVAAFDAASMTKFLQDDLVPEGVFTLNPSITDNSVKYLPKLDELVWHLLGTPGDVARAYRPLLERTEVFLREKAKTVTGDLRVALLTTNTSTEEQLRDVLISGQAVAGVKDASTALSFNGMSSTKNGASRFLDISVDALELAGKPGYRPPDYDAIKAKLAAFKPHVIIALTREEILPIVERYESTLSGSDPIPFWLLGPRNDIDVLPYLQGEAGGSFTEKQARFLGVQYAGAEDRSQRDGWYERMKRRYDSVPVTVWDNTENFYDAVYWIAYGLFAAGRSAPAIGPRIAQGVRNLLDGAPIFPGSSEPVGQAFLQLGFGGARFVGALGPPDFDRQFGAWRSVGGVYCYGGTKDAPELAYDRLRYVAGTTATLKGTLDCTVTNF